MAQISSKTLAWVGIPLFAAGSVAIVNTVTESMLYQIRTSIANFKTAEAANKEVEAHILETMNSLKGTIETAKAMTTVGGLQAHAMIRVAEATTKAADLQAKGVVDATTITMYPETEAYNTFFGPLLGKPTQKITALNDQIYQLKLDGTTGFDVANMKILTQSERADRLALATLLEQQISAVQESSAKNVGDTVGMFFNGMTQGVGSSADLYPRRAPSTPTEQPPPPIRPRFATLEP